jgi:hypothetical protein
MLILPNPGCFVKGLCLLIAETDFAKFILGNSCFGKFRSGWPSKGQCPAQESLASMS